MMSEPFDYKHLKELVYNSIPRGNDANAKHREALLLGLIRGIDTQGYGKLSFEALRFPQHQIRCKLNKRDTYKMQHEREYFDGALPMLSEQLVSVFEQYLPIDKDSPLIRRYGLSVDHLMSNMAHFDQRYQSSIAPLSRGVTDAIINSRYDNDGFDERALKFEEELTQPLVSLANYLKKDATDHYYEACLTVEAMSARNTEWLEPLLKLIREVFTSHFAYYQPYDKVEWLAQVFEVATAYFICAQQQLNQMRYASENPVFQAFTNGLPNDNSCPEDFTINLQIDNAMTVAHAAAGFFDFDVYLEFFLTTIPLPSETDGSLNDLSVIFDSMAKRCLLPSQYAMKELKKFYPDWQLSETMQGHCLAAVGLYRSLCPNGITYDSYNISTVYTH